MTLNDTARLNSRYWKYSNMTRLHNVKVTFICKQYELGRQIVIIRGVYTPAIRITEIISLFSQHRSWENTTKAQWRLAHIDPTWMLSRNYNGTNLKNYNIFTSFCAYGMHLISLESGEGELDKWFPKPEKWDAIYYWLLCSDGRFPGEVCYTTGNNKTSLGAVPNINWIEIKG